MNRNLVRVGLAAGVAGAVALTTVVAAQGESGSGDGNIVSATLTGLKEQPAVVLSTGTGSFRATIHRSDRTIDYRLSYSGLEGDAVQQAHLHIGRRSQAGGISVFLCTNLGNSAGTQACPASGTITGTITPANVIGPTTQAVPAGNFDELLAAIRAGLVYVNVHTNVAPQGEIRGQLH
jgi:hypothetical protein